MGSALGTMGHMAYEPQRRPPEHRNDESDEDDAHADATRVVSGGASDFRWDFEADARAGGTRGRPSDTPGEANRRVGGRSDDRRATLLRSYLDRGLERWWATGELPPRELLQDGLLFLEAGGRLEDAHRALLIRMALAYGRGWQTALRRRGDDELSALVVAESLAGPPLSPLTEPLLDWLMAQGERMRPWRNELATALRRQALEGRGEIRRNSLALLDELDRRTALDEAARAAVRDVVAPRALPLRRLLLLAILLALVGYAVWERLPRVPAGMIMIPAGVYPLRLQTPDGPVVRQVYVQAFALDATEVTNRAYRRCVERGACRAPGSHASATRPFYFLDAAFDDYPVVNVDRDAAMRYCAWLGKRLPGANEWAVAASVVVDAGRQLRYPWGEEFAVQRANSSPLGVGDTLAVGSFRPAGDSPFGMTDMAGNVAEWTVDAVSEGTLAVVKGGSFRDNAEGLVTWNQSWLPVSTREAWLGFRCAWAAD